MKDNADHELEVGQIVAANVSGELGRGEIVALKTRMQYGRERPLIEVKLLHRAAGQPKGHISKITDPKNVLVI